MAKEALEKVNPLAIVNDQFRSPTLAEDLAMACWPIASPIASSSLNQAAKRQTKTGFVLDKSIKNLDYSVGFF